MSTNHDSRTFHQIAHKPSWRKFWPNCVLDLTSYFSPNINILEPCYFCIAAGSEKTGNERSILKDLERAAKHKWQTLFTNVLFLEHAFKGEKRQFDQYRKCLQTLLVEMTF